MASKRTLIPAKHLFTNFRATQQVGCQTVRSMATEAPLSTTSTHAAPPTSTGPSSTSKPLAGTISNPFLTTASCTLYTFPSLSPSNQKTYPSTHLLLPTRRDILHRAVIFEGDATRQGTASTKHRSEVHGSGRKIRPQKGSGSARLGDKKSPMLRGGGVAFGPKPRDFSTDLQRKVYDLAFRTALSVRYRRGELIVVENELNVSEELGAGLERYVSEMIAWNGLKGSVFVTSSEFNASQGALFRALEKTREGRGLWVEEVDVKDLLSLKRLVIERSALERLFSEHQYDLAEGMRVKAWEGSLMEEVQQ